MPPGDFGVTGFKMPAQPRCLLANPTTLLGRTQKDSNRPLLQVAQPLQALEKLLQEREGRYREADTIIDTDELLPEQVVERIIEHAL